MMMAVPTSPLPHFEPFVPTLRPNFWIEFHLARSSVRIPLCYISRDATAKKVNSNHCRDLGHDRQASTISTMTPASSGLRVVTIWSTYGDYHIARLAALAKYGFQVVPFARCEYDKKYPFFQAKPASLVVINRGSADRIRQVMSLWRTWRLLRIHQPDIVVTSGYERFESLAACLYARTSRRGRRRRPVVVLLVNNRAEDHPRRKPVERVKAAYLNVFDGFLASGSDTRDYLARLGVPSSKIEFGLNCVDNDEIAMLVAKHRVVIEAADRKVGYFLCIARLVAAKNIRGVLNAYHSYRRKLSDSAVPTPLVICGEGPERGAIEGLIQQLGLGELVTLLGEIEGLEAVAQQLAGCIALVLASTSNETWGLVVNEAMAAGCPVLVSRQCGCARDLVEHGANGFVFDGQDSDELAGHLLWIHTNHEMLAAMGSRSKEIVRQFAPERFAVSTAKLAAVGGSLARDQRSDNSQIA